MLQVTVWKDIRVNWSRTYERRDDETLKAAYSRVSYFISKWSSDPDAAVEKLDRCWDTIVLVDVPGRIPTAIRCGDCTVSVSWSDDRSFRHDPGDDDERDPILDLGSDFGTGME